MIQKMVPPTNFEEETTRSLLFEFPPQRQQQQQQQRNAGDLQATEPQFLADVKLDFEPSPGQGFESFSVLAFKNLDQILNLDDTNKEQESGSIILSISPNRLASARGQGSKLRKVSYAVPTLTQQSVRNVCVALVGDAWSTDFCRVTRSNLTHTSCSCEGFEAGSAWTRFTVLGSTSRIPADGSKFFSNGNVAVDGGGIFRSASFDDLSTATIIIVAVSASLLVGSLLAAALLVVYCRRVKVRTGTAIFIDYHRSCDYFPPVLIQINVPPSSYFDL